jgi:hypothetical protein
MKQGVIWDMVAALGIIVAMCIVMSTVGCSALPTRRAAEPEGACPAGSVCDFDQVAENCRVWRERHIAWGATAAVSGAVAGTGGVVTHEERR